MYPLPCMAGNIEFLVASSRNVVPFHNVIWKERIAIMARCRRNMLLVSEDISFVLLLSFLWCTWHKNQRALRVESASSV